MKTKSPQSCLRLPTALIDLGALVHMIIPAAFPGLDFSSRMKFASVLDAALLKADTVLLTHIVTHRWMDPCLQLS